MVLNGYLKYSTVRSIETRVRKALLLHQKRSATSTKTLLHQKRMCLIQKHADLKCRDHFLGAWGLFLRKQLDRGVEPRRASRYNADQSRPSDDGDSALIENQFVSINVNLHYHESRDLLRQNYESRTENIIRRISNKTWNSTVLPRMTPACHIKVNLLAAEKRRDCDEPFILSSHQKTVSHKMIHAFLALLHNARFWVLQ